MPTQPFDDAVGPPRPARRDFLHSASAFAAILALAPGAVRAADSWYATWGAAPAGPAPAYGYLAFNNQTVRLIVHASIGGSRVRVRLTNEMGRTAVRIGAAWLGRSSAGASLVAGSNRQLRFSGNTGVTIPAGAALYSDPLDFSVPAQANLALSLYLPDNLQAGTVHDAAWQLNHVSTAGNQAAADTLRVQRTMSAWPFLAEVDIATTRAGATLVALGDSLTDGNGSGASSNQRWPDWLARRLQAEAAPGAIPVGVVNRGISGNRLLGDSDAAPLAGRDALERFDRDVLATAGARYLVVLIGINDIIQSSYPTQALANQITDAYVRLVARARTQGIRVLGGTLPPFGAYAYYSAARDMVRQSVNGWIRGAGAFDGVADFDAAVRDPAQPARLRTTYDSGDHLHPNGAGYQAMARAVPLGLLS